MDLSHRYHEYESGMNALLLSGHAVTILCALRKETLSRDALRDLTGARSTTMRTRIRLLSEAGYLREDASGFALTPHGEEVAEQVHIFLMTMALVTRQKEFWNDHYIEMLPDSAVDTFYLLFDADVDLDTPESIATTITNYFRLVATAHQIYGISEWTATELSEKYTNRVLAGIVLDLIVTKDILCSMFGEPSIGIIRNYNCHPNFRLRVTNIKFWCGMTIADSFFAIKFYSKDGVSHTNARLKASGSEEVIKWGMELFEYFNARSKPLEDYLEEYPDILPSNAVHPDA